jgi:hypothetical protein
MKPHLIIFWDCQARARASTEPAELLSHLINHICVNHVLNKLRAEATSKSELSTSTLPCVLLWQAAAAHAPAMCNVTQFFYTTVKLFKCHLSQIGFKKIYLHCHTWHMSCVQSKTWISQLKDAIWRQKMFKKFYNCIEKPNLNSYVMYHYARALAWQISTRLPS